MKRKIVILVSVFCLLTGCGNNATSQITNTFDVTETVVKDKSTEINEEDNDNKSNKGKQIKYTVNSKTTNGTMVVDAEYKSFPAEQLKTFSMTYQPVTTDYLFDIGSRIFDNKKYESKTPSRLLTSDEALENEAEFERKVEELSSNDIVGGVMMSDHYLFMSTLKNVNYTSEDGSIIVEYQEEFPEDNLVFYNSEAELQGKINGKEYVMTYSKVDTENTKTHVYEKGFGRIRIFDKYALPCKDFYQEFEGDGQNSYCGENLSDYNEALNKSDEFIEKLGFENFKLTKKEYAIVNKDRSGFYTDIEEYTETKMDGLAPQETQVAANGYRFTYTPIIDDIPIFDSSKNILTTEFDDGIQLNENRVEQPVIIIEVDDTGIFYVSISDMYNVVEETSTGTKVVDFEMADANVREAYESNYTDYFTISKIEPEYRVVKYDKNYAMVPVWVYYSSNYGVDENACFAVNAIDGSVYHLTYNFQNIRLCR